MTRKHYVAIARAFESMLPVSDEVLMDLRILANRIAFVAEQDNPRFDRQRFLAACGLS